MNTFTYLKYNLKKNILFKNGGQIKFCDIAQVMLISVKTAQPIWFFFHQKMRNWYLGNYKKKKKRLTQIFTRLKRRRENQNNGSKWTPPMHLSVKVFLKKNEFLIFYRATLFFGALGIKKIMHTKFYPFWCICRGC